MRIEDAIKQSKAFSSSYQRMTVSLLFTNNWLRDRIRGLLKQHGVTVQQYNVLRILRGARGPISTSVIRERLLDKMADTSRLVERMFQKGWVEREICTTDKRLVDISLTDLGLALVNRLDIVNEELDRLSENLTKEEAQLLGNLLDKLRGDE